MHEKYHVNMFIRLSAVYTSRRDHSKDMITKCWVPWLRQFLDKNLLRWNANLSHLLHPLPIALVLKMAHFLLPKAHNLHCIPFSKGNFRQNTYSKSPSLSIFNTPSHWLLVSMVSDEKSALHLIEDFFVWLLVFLHCSQNSLSVFDWHFNNDILSARHPCIYLMWCLSSSLFVQIRVFHHIWKILATNSSNMLSVHFSLFCPSGIPIIVCSSIC